MKEIIGSLRADWLRFGIVVSRFNEFIVESLLSGALAKIEQLGGQRDNITVVRVPGSYEIPLIARLLAESGNYDAIIALGAIIRGATNHYDLVCSQTSSGIASVSLETKVPVIFGVITTDTIEQAIERCGTKAGNKGADAAVTATEMANIVRRLRE